MMKNRFLVCIFLAFILMSFLNFISAEWTENLNDGLIVYYNMDDTTDSIYGLINLSMNEGTAIFNDTNCLIGSCTHTWTDNNLKITGNINTNFSGNWTMNFWVRLRETTPNTYFYGWDSGNEYAMGMDNGPAWLIESNWFGGAHYSGGSPDLYTWYMITMTREDSTNNVTLSIDGQPKHSGTGGSIQSSGNNNIQLGARGTTNELEGSFDEFAYWNRTLNQSEIFQLYNNGDGITYLPIVILEV